ncbi:hypothetical protein AB9F39_37425, partial [Rhizobium leguminosarum]|uniref:hypothetical protein n=1 Tax=Rhizobium leguminosarum TaxID=384 RepID=UPI003F96E452
MADYHLEASWSPIECSFGRLTFTLFNLSTEPLSGFSLAFSPSASGQGSSEYGSSARPGGR